MPTTLPLPSWCMATPPAPRYLPWPCSLPTGSSSIRPPPTPSQVFALVTLPSPANMCAQSPFLLFPLLHLLLYLMKVAEFVSTYPVSLVCWRSALSACHGTLSTWSGAAGAPSTGVMVHPCQETRPPADSGCTDQHRGPGEWALCWSLDARSQLLSGGS